MDGIAKLALTVLAQIATAERIRTTAPQIILAAVLALLVVAAVAGGIGCGVAALWIALLPSVGPWGAPLVCGSVLLLAAAALAGAGYLLLRHRRPKMESGVLAAAIESSDFAPLVHEYKWLLLALALLGGMTAAGRRAKDPPEKP
ncbi:MAG: hypothetical protein KGL11_11305 [Alphaproteobacteria bacterium]|nr:hypothetical protein [Alphaproteobacteria bacterium]